MDRIFKLTDNFHLSQQAHATLRYWSLLYTYFIERISIPEIKGDFKYYEQKDDMVRETKRLRI